MSDLVPMTIKGLMLDPISNAPIVVLKDDSERIFLPIWVGIFEANAIALRLENIETPRPMTHDLLRTLLDTFEAKVLRIVINDLRESTFFATVDIEAGERSISIDARPSDAIALAIRSEAPIFVAQSVLDHAQTIAPDDTQDDRLRRWLEEINPEDLGKYEM
jgi:uncharacterized protein